jgi:ribose transport system ATP-binding protein
MEHKKDPALELVDITKSFPGVKALDQVSIKAYPGEIIGLVGENGAGKSTLMNVLGGVVLKDSGKILIENKEVDLRSPLDAQAEGISFIHQEPTLFTTLNVAENIFITRFPRIKNTGFINNSKIYTEAKEALRKLGEEIKPQYKVRNLTMGQRQVVEIARAFAANSKIIIFDEPTSSLTLKEKSKLFEVVELLKKQNVAIIYISHLLEEVFEICDRIYVLRDGKNVGTLIKKDTNPQQVIELMIGGKLKGFFPRRKKVSAKEILKVEGLSRSNVLKNIDLKIRKGEIVGLWGLMGSGRTEIARAILGLDPVDKGQAWFNEQKIPLSLNRQIMKRSGFIPENRRDEGMFPTSSVLRNISVANLKALTGKISFFINQKKERHLAKNLINQLKIVAASLEQAIDFLSGGNQQKVIIARWLQRHPDLYILDEPTRGIDVGAKAEIHNLIGDLADQGAGVLLISSEIEEVLGMSSRIIVLRNGEIVAELEKDNANKQKLMKLASGL